MLDQVDEYYFHYRVSGMEQELLVIYYSSDVSPLRGKLPKSMFTAEVLFHLKLVPANLASYEITTT
jgi:hypothetical protein